MPDEFNAEQQTVIALLTATGVPDPEAVVRGARMDATAIGSAFAPSLHSLAAAMTTLIDSFARALDAAGTALADEAERIANDRAPAHACCSTALPPSPVDWSVPFTQGPAWECPECGDIWLWDDASGWERDPENDRD